MRSSVHVLKKLYDVTKDLLFRICKLNKMVLSERACDKKRALTVFLHSEKGYSCRQISLNVKISKSSVSRILKEDFKTNKNDKKESKIRGRPSLLSVRDERNFVTRLRLTNPNFTAMDVVHDSGIDPTIAKYRTSVSYLNKLGYKFRQTRKKGRLCEKDFQKRRKYARAASKLDSTYWTKDVAFILMVCHLYTRIIP